MSEQISIPKFSTENRNLGGFKITLDDLMSQAVSEKRAELELADTYRAYSNLVGKNAKEILEAIYKGRWKNSSFHKKASRYAIVTGRQRLSTDDGDVPFGIAHPKWTIGLLSFIFIVTAVMTVWPIISDWGGSPYLINFAPAFVLFTSFVAISTNTIRHVLKDLKLVEEFRAKIELAKRNLEDEIIQFREQLESDNVFFLTHLIAQLRKQKKIHMDMLNQEKLKLSQMVYNPREEAQQKVEEIENQIKNIYKMKKVMSSAEVEQRKENLRFKSWELKKSITEFKPAEQAIKIELEKFDAVAIVMDKTISELVKQRAELMDNAQQAKTINRLLGTEAIDWDFVQRSNYERQLQKSLSNLQSLNESLIQIVFAANEAVRLLPPAWQPKELVA